MAERPYEVTDTGSGVITHVIAKTPAQALYSVMRGRFKAKPMSALEVARLPAGTAISDATAEPQQPLDDQADGDGKDPEDDSAGEVATPGRDSWMDKFSNRVT